MSNNLHEILGLLKNDVTTAQQERNPEIHNDKIPSSSQVEIERIRLECEKEKTRQLELHLQLANMKQGT